MISESRGGKSPRIPYTSIYSCSVVNIKATMISESHGGKTPHTLVGALDSETKVQYRDQPFVSTEEWKGPTDIFMRMKQHCIHYLCMSSHAARKRPFVGELEGEYGERKRRAEKKMRQEMMMTTSDQWKRTVEEQCKKKKQAWSVQTLRTRTPPTYKLPDYSKITWKWWWWWCLVLYQQTADLFLPHLTSPTNNKYSTCYNDTSSSSWY